MNKIIFWEDLKLETDLATGMVEEIDDNNYEDNSEVNVQELISSPFGVFHIKDYFNPVGQYSWFMGHTNFNISRNFVEELALMEGIEKLIPISRYRFLMAIGKVFNANKIKQDIYDQFRATPYLSDLALGKIADLKGLYDEWSLYFLDKDDWKYTCEADEDFHKKVSQFRVDQKKFGGIIIDNESNI